MASSTVLWFSQQGPVAPRPAGVKAGPGPALRALVLSVARAWGRRTHPRPGPLSWVTLLTGLCVEGQLGPLGALPPLLPGQPDSSDGA